MDNHSQLFAMIALYAVIAYWFVFATIFMIRKHKQDEKETKHDDASRIGIALQGCAFGLTWLFRPRAQFLPQALTWPASVSIAMMVFIIALATASVWLVATAVKTLGKQWAYVARLVEGHKLITDGPYRFVRNPIYTGMFGMLVATGLATEHWIQLAIAVVIFAIGTVVRVRSEEKLLQTAFGQEWDDYAKRVPAVIPGIY